MSARDWEKAKAAARQRKRGVERPSDSGFTVELASRAAKGVARAEAFIREARTWAPIEEVAERNTAFEERRRASTGSGASLREILDACED